MNYFFAKTNILENRGKNSSVKPLKTSSVFYLILFVYRYFWTDVMLF